MSYAVLFIGGSLDGKWEGFDELLSYYCVPLRTAFVRDPPKNPERRPSFRYEEYLLVEIGPFWVYRLREMAPNDMLYGLLNGYSHSRSAKEPDHEKCIRSHEEICQILGQALGYPWYKDDQANFPGATEKDGVCVGDHVAESLAQQAADRIRALEAQSF